MRILNQNPVFAEAAPAVRARAVDRICVLDAADSVMFRPSGAGVLGDRQPGAYSASPGLRIAAPGYTLRPLRGQASTRSKT